MRVDGGQILRKGLRMAKGKSKIPENETPAQCFKRIVEPRVGKALKAIGLVGSVTGQSYKATDAQHALIVTALRDAVDKVEQRFAGKGDKAAGFKLS